MKNRSSSEIIPIILESCIGGCRITKIMLTAELSHGQTRAYLNELLQSGFLTLDADEALVYTTTPDGIKYLHGTRTLLELLAKS